MATQNGVVKKTGLDEYKNVRRSGLIAIRIRDDDELRWVRQTNGEQNIILVTRQGQSINFHESDVRPMGRASMGVRGIKLKKENDRVVTMGVVNNDDNLILTVCENGLGKCSSINQYKVQKRGGSGIKTHLITKKTGAVIGARIIDADRSGDIILMSEKGVVIRLPLKSINKTGRATQGVTVMRFKNTNDKVACLAIYNAELFKSEAQEEKTQSLTGV